MISACDIVRSCSLAPVLFVGILIPRIQKIVSLGAVSHEYGALRVRVIGAPHCAACSVGLCRESSGALCSSRGDERGSCCSSGLGRAKTATCSRSRISRDVPGWFVLSAVVLDLSFAAPRSSRPGRRVGVFATVEAPASAASHGVQDLLRLAAGGGLFLSALSSLVAFIGAA